MLAKISEKEHVSDEVRGYRSRCDEPRMVAGRLFCTPHAAHAMMPIWASDATSVTTENTPIFSNAAEHHLKVGVDAVEGQGDGHDGEVGCYLGDAVVGESAHGTASREAPRTR